MKAFFAMTAAVLMTVTMLFAALPGIGLAAEGKVTLAEMVKIKKAADEAAQSAKAQAEKAKTAEEKRLAKQLVKQAEINAEVAGDLLEAVKDGEEVSREEAQACAAIAKAVHKAASALAAGNVGKAGDALDRIGELGSSLPTAANARAEMQRADGTVRWQQTPDINGTDCPSKDSIKYQMEYGCSADGLSVVVKQFKCTCPDGTWRCFMNAEEISTRLCNAPCTCAGARCVNMSASPSQPCR